MSVSSVLTKKTVDSWHQPIIEDYIKFGEPFK